jgi:hypothetical protein
MSEHKKLRTVRLTVADCPINPDLPLTDCKKCPHYGGWDDFYKKVICLKLSKRELDMLPPEVKKREPKSRW